MENRKRIREVNKNDSPEQESSKKVKLEDNDGFSIYPSEIIVSILEYADDQTLCQAGAANKQFYDCANTTFESRLKRIAPMPTGLSFYTSGLKPLYFMNKTAFQDAVNRVLSFVFPRYIDEGKKYFLTPDQDYADFEEATDAEMYYLPLIKTIRNFDILCVLKEVLSKINSWPGEWSVNCYKKLRKQDENTLMHYFIGTMNIDVVRLLLENDESLNSRDRFTSTPIHILFSVIAYNRCQKSENKYRNDPWPTFEFIEFLLANGADFNCQTDTDRTIIDYLDLSMYPLLESESSGLRIFAFLFTKNALSLSENDFREKLSPGVQEIYDKEKEKIMEKISNQEVVISEREFLRFL